MKLLNEKYSLSNGNNHLRIVKGSGGLPVIDIENKFAKAVISLQGAHVLSWTPESQEDVIWLSENASFQAISLMHCVHI